MMRTLVYLGCNLVWISFYLVRYLLFRISVYFPRQVQTRYLRRLVRENRYTVFGREHQFDNVASIPDFQQLVPLSTYESYQHYIEQIGCGDPSVLTEERVDLLELSSGSTSASKLIPYTKALKKEFGNGIGPWMFDMYLRNPSLLLGTAYWSITPLAKMEKTYTAGGIPIGFEEDSEYFGRVEKFLIETLMAVPPEVKHVSSNASFRYLTLFFLLQNRDLTFISVWNPTFLSILLDDLRMYWEPLLTDMKQGSLTPPEPIAENLKEQLLRRVKPDERRAAELRTLGSAQYRHIWPKLRLISCWTDGNSALYAEQLRQRVSGIRVKGKGLIATEGFISFPVEGTDSSVLAIRSHFYEFIDVEEQTGQTHLAHELTVGNRYSVVITTGGGLYRYRLQDVVEVTGYMGRTPLIRFVGKADKVSDHFGEKLNEQHVSEVLDMLCLRLAVSPDFLLLAPDCTYHTYHYTLYIETDQELDTDRLVEQLDAGLCQNFHYAYCRRLGQLTRPRIYKVSGSGAVSYLRRLQAEGQKLGNIKPSSLHAKMGWSEWFAGIYLDSPEMIQSSGTSPSDPNLSLRHR
ncbi:GH3 auxin-responsive promoter family protein [Brevibacillus sp. H7]|uniref:GH3 auxin-responsive promoter family protein n=1 Tax=Brevibacillus sp. H7 TaxID=3349138 RepID=UPI0037F6B360